MAVDFGFGLFLEKFEEHYGKTTTKCLVGLIGVAVFAVCCNLIWGFLAPIVGWTTNTAEGSSLVWMAWRALSFVAGFCILVAGSVLVVSAFQAKVVLGTLGDTVDDTMDRVTAASDQVASLSNLTASLTNQATSASEQLNANVAESRKLLEVTRERYRVAEETLAKAQATLVRVQAAAGRVDNPSQKQTAVDSEDQ